jgi:ADP-heptose:LPS heptosyltransferase
MEALAKAGRAYGHELSNTLQVRSEYLPLFSGGLVNCVGGTHTDVPSPYVKWRAPENRVHIRDTIAKLSQASDLSLVQILPLAREERHPNNTIIFCPVSAKDHKHWLVNYWREVALWCLNAGYSIFVNTQDPMPGLTDLDRFKVSYGMPELQWLAIMMRDAAAVVSVDTGPMHIADAVGNPPVGIFTATSSITYGPYNDNRFVVDGLTPTLSAKDPTYTAPHSNTMMHRQSVDAFKRVLPHQVIAMLGKRLSLNIPGKEP